MRKLKKVSTDPPGGWYFVFQDGAVVKAGNYDKLIVGVKKHLSVNDEDIPDNLEEIVHDQICTHVPPNFCDGEDLANDPISYEQCLEATKKLISTGRKTADSKVPVKVAIERIDICVSCRFNVSRLGCFTCSMPYKYSVDWAKGLPLGSDSFLHHCDIFGPVGRALIFSSDKLLRLVYDSIDKEKPPDNCWIKEILSKEPEDG